MLSTIFFGLLANLWIVNAKLTGDNILYHSVFDRLNFSGQLEQRVAEAARQATLNILPLSAAARPEEPRPLSHLPAARDLRSLAPICESEAKHEVTADSAVVLDTETGTVLFKKDDKAPKSIASITKLATALVFLDHNPGWEYVYEIRESDRREGSKVYLAVGERAKVKDLFYLSLVASANTETVALVNSTGLKMEEFVGLMNDKARELGLTDTVFKDAVGLDAGNVSTALDVARLAKAALEMEDIRQATITKRHEFTTMSGNKISVDNTDKLLEVFAANPRIRIIGGKTGYTEEAGGCLASKWSNESGHEVISVLLGGDDRISRFSETKSLVEWVYTKFRWPE